MKNCSKKYLITFNSVFIIIYSDYSIPISLNLMVFSICLIIAGVAIKKNEPALENIISSGFYK